MTGPITVAVVDDQMLVRAGLRMILDAEEDIGITVEAADGQQAVRAIRQHRPDVALMDIRMPVMDGIAATRQLLAESGLATRILVLTTFDTDEAVTEALAAGASGFLVKDTEPDDLVRAVRAVAAGDAVVSPPVLRRLLAVLGPRFSSGSVSASDPADHSDASPGAGSQDRSRLLRDLTDREVEVLTLIGRGETNAEIAAELVVAESTVKTHVSRILLKLGARDRVRAVIIAHRAGLVG